MSFVAVIDSEENKHFWSRSIFSLSTISDQIKFILTSESLSISAVNNAKTAHGEVIFNSSFFSKYEINFNMIISEGFEPASLEDDKIGPSYSFILNSKSLSLLFKKMEPDLDYILLQINCSQNCPLKIKYKFMVEIKTKDLIVKKLSAFYQPCLRNKLKIARLYKEKLREQNEQSYRESAQENATHRENNEDDLNRINYLMIERLIPRNFIEKIPSGTEDFRVEIKNGKISLTGFTKQIMKEKEYLKQPMSVSITLNLDELLNNSLQELSENELLSINFRLKYFKNFLSLSSSTTTNDDYFEIMFSKPGEPVLFEMDSHSATIQFIQISDGESVNKEGTGSVLPSNIVHKVPNTDANLTKSISITQLRKPGPGNYMPSLNRKRVDREPILKPIPAMNENYNEDEGHDLGDNHDNDNFSLFVPHSQDVGAHKDTARGNTRAPEEETITWNLEPEKEENRALKYKRSKTTARDRSTRATDSHGAKSRLPAVDEEEISGSVNLGPTQNVSKPKGLFD